MIVGKRAQTDGLALGVWGRHSYRRRVSRRKEPCKGPDAGESVVFAKNYKNNENMDLAAITPAF